MIPDLLTTDLRPDECLELRILGERSNSSGYFTDPEALIAAAQRATKNEGNAYYTLNPVPIDLMARTGANQLKSSQRGVATSDADVVRRRFLMLDLDYQRASGIPASASELASALELGERIVWDLSLDGWPLPAVIHTGNGCQLLYRVDLPNDQPSLDMVKRVLAWAQQRWGSGPVKIDQTVCNAARISRLPGCLNRKGAGSPTRPHRMATLEALPSDFRAVPTELLQACRPVESPKPTSEMKAFDIQSFAERHFPGASPQAYNGGTKWVLPVCPWNEQHTDRSAFIIQFPSGAIAAGCHHNGCTGRSWADLREMLEPKPATRPRQEARKAPATTREVAEVSQDAEEAPGGPEAAWDISDDLNEQSLTDLGNAKCFARLYAHRCRWNNSEKYWLIWDGKRWIEDKLGKVKSWANKTIQARIRAADAKDRALALNFLRRCENLRSRDSLLGQAQAWMPLVVTTEQLDQDEWLLNCANGILDLRTGTLGPHDPDRLMTKLVNVEYNPRATCERWIEYLQECMLGDQEMVDYLQRAVGYSLTCSTREQCLFVMVGKGGNGKSVFISILEDLLGSYMRGIPQSSLIAKAGASIPNDIAALNGCRVARAAEMDAKAVDEALIKQLTGRDTISARFMRAEFFDYRPQFKIWATSNDMPIIRGNDDGIWRRFHFVQWKAQFLDGDPKTDRDLPERLREELPGILAWAVRGCLTWQMAGLQRPRQANELVERHRDASNTLKQFLEQCCEVDLTDVTLATNSGDFYRAFSDFCGYVGEPRWSHRKTSQTLAKLGIALSRTNATRKLIGVKLL